MKTRTNLLFCKALLLLLCSLSFFSSCSKNDYTNVIPATSTVLVKIDATNTNAKSFCKAINTWFPKIDATDSGLDYSSNIYAFETLDGNLGLCLRVADFDKIKHVVETLANEGKCGKIRKVGDVVFSDFNKSWAIGISENCMLVLGPVPSASISDLQRSMVRLFKQKAESSITQRPIFALIDSMRGPVDMVAQVQALPEKFVTPLMLDAPDDVDASQLYVSATIDKQDGVVVLDGKTTSFDGRIVDQLAKTDNLYRKIRGTFVGNIPSNSVFGICTNVDGKRFLPKLQAQKSLQSLLFGINTAIDFDNILRSVDGDFILAFNGLDDEHLSSTIYASVTNPKWKDDVDYWKQSCPHGSTITGNEKVGWSYIGGDTHFYFGIESGKNFYGTSEKNAILDGAKHTAVPKSLQSKISDCRLALFLNVKALCDKGGDTAKYVSILNRLLGDTDAVVYLLK